jgi:hypothetical protein
MSAEKSVRFVYVLIILIYIYVFYINLHIYTYQLVNVKLKQLIIKYFLGNQTVKNLVPSSEYKIEESTFKYAIFKKFFLIAFSHRKNGTSTNN